MRTCYELAQEMWEQDKPFYTRCILDLAEKTLSMKGNARRYERGIVGGAFFDCWIKNSKEYAEARREEDPREDIDEFTHQVIMEVLGQQPEKFGLLMMELEQIKREGL